MGQPGWVALQAAMRTFINHNTLEIRSSSNSGALPVCDAVELHGGVIIVFNVRWPHRLRLLDMDLDLHPYRESTLSLPDTPGQHWQCVRTARGLVL